MSKVVKKVGKAIKKVVSGINKAVKKVRKKIMKSKFFKVIATAALVYFGGAALMGGFSTIGTSGSFLQGMSTGLSNAWAGVTGATSSALGGNFAQAGSQLAAGAKGATLNTVTGATTNAAGTIAAKTAAANTTNAQALASAQNALSTTGPLTPTQLAANAGQQSVLTQTPAQFSQTVMQSGTPLTTTGQSVAGSVAPGVAPGVAPSTTGVPLNVSQTLSQNAAQTGPGLLQSGGTKAAKTGLFSSPYTAPALVMTGGQMLSGYATGKAQEQAMEQARADAEAQALAYGQNVGSYIGMPVYNPNTGQYEYVNENNMGGVV